MTRTDVLCRRIPSWRGVTLIELIAFIAIAGVVAVTLVQVFSGTLKGAHTSKEMTQGMQLAQQRMEVIRGQRKILGFVNFTSSSYDPCKPPLAAPWDTARACNTTSYGSGSFTVSSSAEFPPAFGTCATANCKQVTVTVQSPGGQTVAVLTEQFWNY